MLYRSANRPSGVVAQIGAALAVLYGLGSLVGGISLVADFVHDRSRFDNSLVIFTALGAALMVAVMIFGGVRLWRQDETGRYTLIVASGLSLAIGIVGLAVSLTDYEFGLGIFWWSTADHSLWVSPLFGLVGQLTALIQENLLRTAIDLAQPLLILALCASRFAARWTAARPTHHALTY
ncbi:hypothetical protein [Nocardia anaemiae]|uniref:hypothetical protein n=1 Tax=Nocardia anaemiae TaxID=263910 RepID=UPI0007A565F2|nr:hypothetical protein [Nocardia anaemiae]